MDNVKNYVIIMCDSLKKKLTILSGIILENHKQQMICTADKFDEEAFEATLTRKDEFIEQFGKRYILKKRVNALLCFFISLCGTTAVLYSRFVFNNPLFDRLRYMTFWGTIFTSAVSFIFGIVCIMEAVKETAVKAYRAIGCCGLSRVDFFVTDSGELILNEINTLPGFTSISMYPKLWGAEGVAYDDLIDRLIRLALERKGDCRG